MKKLALKFTELKLNQQFALVMLVVLLVPVLTLSSVLFENMRAVIIDDKISTTSHEMEQKRVNLEKAVELCNMTTQVFLNNTALREYLHSVCDGQKLTTAELLAFKDSEINAFEKLVNANPYLYQVRVYSTSGGSPEMMPILYDKNRMENLSWAHNEWVSGSWQFDFTDTIFSESVVSPTEHIMALVTGIDDYEHGRIGVLEVAIHMDELMGELFADNKDKWACLIDDNGTVYCNRSSSSPFVAFENEIISMARENNRLTASVSLGGTPALVSSIWLKPLGARYIEVVSLKDIAAQTDSQRNLLFAAVILLLVLLVFLVNILVKVMLRRFYSIFNTVAQAGSGNLTASVHEWGGGEIGLFGKHINAMLERIEQLMHDNINKQILAKNSEIRALQNQINAHFIYNVLESIKMMAEVDEKYDISNAVTALGKLLRYSMRWTKSRATVGEEIEYVRNYLALMNLRFDYAVSLNISIPADIMSQLIPKMSLQPVVENAIIHGFEEITEDCMIDISAINGGNCFEIEITDYGKGMTTEQLASFERRMAGEAGPESGGNGIGLKNVQDRIKIAFGTQYGITLDSKAGTYTKVKLKLPYLTPGEEAAVNLEPLPRAAYVIKEETK